ncbi:MAG: hypothetical protein MUO73_05635 [Thermoplasmata archaeon]|nr:hypothetical protein [Thermoplasmata archaeon]
MPRKHQGLPHTIRPTTHQTGRTNQRADAARNAMLPGLRISKTGHKYAENRRNRSDLRGKRT